MSIGVPILIKVAFLLRPVEGREDLISDVEERNKLFVWRDRVERHSNSTLLQRVDNLVPDFRSCFRLSKKSFRKTLTADWWLK